MIHVLLVDDEPEFLSLLKRCLENDAELTITTSSSIPEAMEKLKAEHFDAIVSDYAMPDMNGLILLQQLKEQGIEKPFIIFTGIGRDNVAIEAWKHGADYFLEKGGDPKMRFSQLSYIIELAVKRKKAEEQLKISEKRYREFVESIEESVYMVDRECRYLLMNTKHLKRLGKVTELYAGMPYAHFHSPEETELFQELVNRVFETGIPLTDEYERDGRIFIRRFNPNRDAVPGQVIAVTVVSSEKTETFQLVQELEKQIAANETLEEYTEDSIYSIDRDCRYLSMNTNHLGVLGISADTFLNTRYDQYHPREQSERFSQMVNQIFETGASIRDEYEENGRYFIRQLNPVRNRKTRITESVTVLSNEITERKLAEKALYEANKKLNLLNSITRHDILNQLTVLSGYLDLSEPLITDPRLKEYHEKEVGAADVIRYQITFTREYQDIGVTIPVWQNLNDIITLASSIVNLGNVWVEAACHDIIIFADPLLEKVFFNLMDNAIRYGEKLTKIRFYWTDGTNGLSLFCEDDGVGVADKEKEQIFRRGYGKNTGYGLFLVREILSITDITITENGEPGKGARFEIKVPKGAYRFSKIQ